MSDKEVADILKQAFREGYYDGLSLEYSTLEQAWDGSMSKIEAGRLLQEEGNNNG